MLAGRSFHSLEANAVHRQKFHVIRDILHVERVEFFLKSDRAPSGKDLGHSSRSIFLLLLISVEGWQSFASFWSLLVSWIDVGFFA